MGQISALRRNREIIETFTQAVTARTSEELELLEGPPVSLISFRPGRGANRFRIELEITFEVAEWLGKVGSIFWPVFGKIEEEKRAREKSRLRKENIERTLQRGRLAGRAAYFSCRAIDGLAEREKVLEAIGEEYGYEPATIELLMRNFKQKHLAKLRPRRTARMKWRYENGCSIPEIAKNFRVSVTTVRKAVLD